MYDLGAGSAGMAGYFLAFGAIAIVLAIAVYIYVALAVMFIAKKTKTKNPWLAFIPIANFYLLTQIAKKNAWWTLILLAVFVPVIGGLVVGAVAIWFFWIVVEKIKFPGWTSLLLIIPVVNLIMLGIWAWSKK